MTSNNKEKTTKKAVNNKPITAIKGILFMSPKNLEVVL